MKKRFGIGGLVLACVLGAALAGGAVFLCFVSYFGGLDMIGQAGKFASAYHILDNYYVGEADMEKVTEAAYDAMIAAIGDRWSYYMTPQEYESYKEMQSNSYTGIGITIAAGEEDGYLTVKGVTEGSPAHRAGVRTGDRLYELNGQSLAGMDSSQVKSLITETEGREFQLTLMDNKDELRTVTVKAESIFTDPVEHEMLEGGIAYIRIKNFESQSSDQAIEALEELMEQGAEAVVFDVRGNPGGLLSQLTALLDYLLPEGDMFVSVDQNGRETVKTSDGEWVDLPMTVLINGDTYSAAEFFAAALSEYGMAETVGEPSTGKSRSQVNLFLPDGSVFHLSTNGYLTPNRVDLAEQGGLVPDRRVSFTQEERGLFYSGELSRQDDRQLQEALKVLTEKVA